MKNQKSNKTKKQKNGVSFILTVGLILLSGYFLISFIHTRVEISKREKARDEVSSQIEQQQDKNAKLQAVIDGDKGDYMEKIAREELGYGKLGEKFFYNITPGVN